MRITEAISPLSALSDATKQGVDVLSFINTQETQSSDTAAKLKDSPRTLCAANVRNLLVNAPLLNDMSTELEHGFEGDLTERSKRTVENERYPSQDHEAIKSKNNPLGNYEFLGHASDRKSPSNTRKELELVNQASSENKSSCGFIQSD